MEDTVTTYVHATTIVMLLMRHIYDTYGQYRLERHHKSVYLCQLSYWFLVFALQEGLSSKQARIRMQHDLPHHT